MTTPITLPPPPRALAATPEAAEWARWFQQLQTSIATLATSRSYEVLQSPATGFTHSIPVGQGLCLLLPAAGIASGTVTLPAAAADGFEQQILSSQTVTSLTVAAAPGQTIVGTAVFALAAGVRAVFRWRAGVNVWYRMQ